jgi:hypothetical protein
VALGPAYDASTQHAFELRLCPRVKVATLGGDRPTLHLDGVDHVVKRWLLTPVRGKYGWELFLEPLQTAGNSPEWLPCQSHRWLIQSCHITAATAAGACILQSTCACWAGVNGRVVIPGSCQGFAELPRLQMMR